MRKSNVRSLLFDLRDDLGHRDKLSDTYVICVEDSKIHHQQLNWNRTVKWVHFYEIDEITDEGIRLTGDQIIQFEYISHVISAGNIVYYDCRIPITSDFAGLVNLVKDFFSIHPDLKIIIDDRNVCVSAISDTGFNEVDVLYLDTVDEDDLFKMIKVNHFNDEYWENAYALYEIIKKYMNSGMADQFVVRFN